MLAQRQLGQKIKDSHTKATNRDEDRPAIGALSEENAKNNSERGDCIRWTTKGQCSDGEACAFKHDPNKNGKGKGRPRSLSSTGAPHRNSNCDGKGSDDGSAIRVVKVRQGKQKDYLVQNSKQEVAKGEIHVIVGMFPNVQNSSLCRFEHSATLDDEKINSASTAIQIPSNDDEQMQSNDKTQFRVRLRHLATKYVLKKKIGIFTWSHPDRISKSAKSRPSNIRRKINRMDFKYGRNSQKISLDFAQERVHNSWLIFQESKHVLHTKSRWQCFFTF